ncbi:MAG TPA: DUF99 family protein [Candidatus Bathyarchaeia archaeon]|nr:DUF99 family protein [Candidatus Bathyarchaeia archaeon]
MTSKILRVIKPEIRVLGVDDGKFTPHSKDPVLVVGVVFRGGYSLDGVMHTFLTVDEFDATEKIAEMIICSPHYKQLRVIMLNGITFAGFNIVDIRSLNVQTKLPVIAVMQKKPNLAKIHQALMNLPNCEDRWKAIINAGEIFQVTTRNGKQRIYIEFAGIEKDTAQAVLRLTSTRSNIPEALRAAHLIASGITTS